MLAIEASCLGGAGVGVLAVHRVNSQIFCVDGVQSSINTPVFKLGMTHMSGKLVDCGLHFHRVVHIIKHKMLCVNAPGGALGRVGLLNFLVGVQAQVHFSTRELAIKHVDFVVVKVDVGTSEFAVFYVGTEHKRRVLAHHAILAFG